MALKFRRGTTAQKSGSLSFGEPYVNTTLGTLQIGLDTGDVTLLINSSSAGISGSSLDITGNAKIDGNLRVGGQLTIGDQTSDTVNVVASLSSSLIPQTTNAFDLGSADKIWKDLYISTGSIKFVAGTSIVKELTLATITGLESATGSSNVSITNLNSFTSSINTTIKTQLNTNSVVSGSSQIDGASLGSNKTITIGSTTITLGGSNTTLSGLSSVSATGFTGSLNGNASTATALQTARTINATSFDGSSNITILNLVSGSSQVTSSLDGRYELQGRGVVSSSTQVTSLLPTGTVSGSSQVSYVGLSNTPAGIVSGSSQVISLLPTGVVSGSSQITIESTTGFTSYSSSVDSRILTEKGRIDAILSASSADADTFAEIVSLINSVDLTNDNAFATFYTSSVNRLNNLESTSGSNNISISNINSFTSSINTTIKDKLNVEAVVSSSAQVVGILSSLNTYTGSNDTTNTTQNSRLTNLESTSASVNGHIADINAYTSSNNTLNSLQTTRIDQLAGLTSSVSSRLDQLSTDSGSQNTRITTLESKATTLQTYTSSIDGHIVDINAYTASNNTTNTTQNNRLSRLEESTSSLNVFSSSINGHVSDINTKTGSFENKFTTLESYTASLETKNSTLASVSASLLSSQTNLNTYTGSLLNAFQVTGSRINFLGDVVIYGTQSVINSQNVQIADNILYLAPTASIDNDLGIVGHYNDGTYRHAGIFMDASDGHSWKVFNGLQDETSAQIDTNGTGFTLADFKAGAFTGTSFTGQILATNGVVSGSSQVSYVALSNIPSGIVSSSAQIDALFNLDGIFSGSSQVNATATTNWSTGIKTELNTNTVISGSSQVTGISNAQLTNSSVTVTAGTGLSGGGAVSLGSSVTLTNAGVTSNVAGSGISVSGATGAVTITNTGVTSNVAGTGVSVSGATGAVTISIGQAVATSSNVQFNSLGIGMAASATAGRIDASGDIVAYSTSDRNFKENITPIPNALEKISKISGNTYDWKEDMKEYHGFEGNDVGVIAQEIEEVLPQLVTTRETGYKAVKYDKLVALLIEGIKEQQQQIHSLTLEVQNLKKQKGL